MTDFDTRIRNALAARLSERWTGGVRVGELAPFGDGHSGVTYAVTVEADGHDGHYVVRLSSAGARIAGPNDVGRQGRIMSRLHTAGFPVPRILDSSSDPVIDGRSFALMETVRGTSWDRSGLDDQAVARSAAQLAQRLASLDIASSGVIQEKAFSPVEELARWAHLLPRCPEDLRAEATSLMDQLALAAPSPAPPVLVHGDFHYGNLLFERGEIVAVLDWEIASLGQPLQDLGCLAVASLRRKYEPEPNPTGSVAVDLEELATFGGVRPEALSWYVAANCFKYAVILGYNLVLHRRGKKIDATYEDLTKTMYGLVADGRRLGSSVRRSRTELPR